MTPRSCEQAREWLAAAVDADLPATDRDALDAHLAGCDACREVATWIPAVDPLVASLPDRPEPDAAYFRDLSARVMAQVDEPAPPAATPWWRRWPALAPAALVVALLGVTTVRQALQDPPQAPTASLDLDRVDPGTSIPEAQVDERESGIEDDEAPAEVLSLQKAPAAELEEEVADPAPPEALPSVPRKIAGARERASAQRKDVGKQALADVAQDGFASPPTTLRALFQRARAQESTPDEADALAALIGSLEATANTPSVDTRLEANREGVAKSAPSRALARVQEAMPAPTLADSVAVHLRTRLDVLADPDLRARARTQIQRFLRE